MKKTLAIILIMVQLFVLTTFINADSIPASDYDLYYSQYVDNKELSVLQEKDVYLWNNGASIYPAISQVPNDNRKDYLDISYGADPMQKLDIHHLKDSYLKPVIFYIHGGGWVEGDKDQTRYFANSWLSLGYTVVSINYRLAPQNPHPAQIEDCAKALKWVMDNINNYGGNPNKIAIVGHSSGAHLAALLVSGEKWHKAYDINMSKVKCWIPLSGIYDFDLKENFYHPAMIYYTNAYIDSPNTKKDASQINYVTGKEPPSLIVHGGDDWLVPKTNATTLYNKLKQKGANSELQIVKGYRHTNIMVTYGEPGHVPTYLVNKFLAKHLPTTENNLLKYYIEYLIEKFKD